MKSIKSGSSTSIIVFGIFILFAISYSSEKTSIATEHLQNVPLTNAPELSFLQIYSITDRDDSNTEGNNNNLLDAGETVDVMLQIQNLGDTEASNVTVEISCDDNFVNIPVSSSNYSTINSASSKIGLNALRIQVNSSCPANKILNFTLNITADGYFESSYIQLQVHGAPNPKFYYFDVYAEYNDGLPADDDGIIDAGEDVTVHFYVQNLGTATIFGLDGYLSTLDEDIKIDDGEGYYGDIDGANDYDYGSFGFRVLTSKLVPDKQIVSLNLSLVDQWNTIWNLAFEITINGTASFELETYEFDEDYGDEDGEIDAGESWDLRLHLRNNGTARAIDYSIFVDSNDPYLTFQRDSSDRTTIYDNSYDDTIHPNITTWVSGGNWEVEMSHATPLDHIGSLVVYITDTTTGSIQFFTILVKNHGISNYSVENLMLTQYSGDDDLEIDAGESWYFSINLSNRGKANGEGIHVKISSNNPNIVFYYAGYDYNNISINHLNSESNISLSESTNWRIKVSEDTLRDQTINFTIIITDSSHRVWYHDFEIDIIEGKLLKPYWITIIILGVIGILVTAMATRIIYLRNQKEDNDREKKIKRKTFKNQRSTLRKLKSLRYPFQWELKSRQPEVMLKNINNMHQYSLVLIRRKQYSKVDSVISDEIRQYKHTKKLLKEMDLLDLAEKIQKKLHIIKNLRYQVRDTAFSTSYQDLMEHLQTLQNQEKYKKVNQKILKMKDVIADYQKFLKSNRKTKELVKIQDIETSLLEMERFNSNILQVKSYESNHNKIGDLLEKNHYKQAYQLTTSTLHSIETFLGSNPGFENELYLEMISGVETIQTSLIEVESRITKSYENLIDGTAASEVFLPKKTITIQAPEFQSITPPDLDAFLKELDSQFTEWNEGNRGKMDN